MALESAIEWTNSTWNPVTGCTKLSAGCDHCYAERFSERFRGVKNHPFESGFDLTLRPARIDQPRIWRKPKFIFVNSMSDLFHKDIPLAFIDQIFDTMESADWHIYQILTKRSSLMRNYVNQRYLKSSSPPHIWLGVSIENSATLGRLMHLKATNASMRFISFEPLLGKINNVDLSGIHWVIAGGESGPGCRLVDIDWLRELRDQCQNQQVPFFFKQWGGRTPKAGGNTLDGDQWLEFPKINNNQSFDTPLRVAGAPPVNVNPPMEVGPWAQEKLECLRKYLSAYTKIMSKQREWCKNYCYVDAFAGPGTLKIRKNNTNTDIQEFLPVFNPTIEENDDSELQQLISGSPKIALDVTPSFTEYLFVELDSEHLESLNELTRTYQNKDFQIDIQRGDCNNVLRKWLEQTTWNNRRGVIFLDPFGMQVPWDTIEKIASTNALEIIMNFPVGMAIQRLLKKSGEFSPQEKNKLSNYFGTEEWFEALYKNKKDLLGESAQKVSQSGKILLHWYSNRLRNIFKFVSEPRAVKSTRNNTLYYLLFAGHNETGYKIASDILNQGVALTASTNAVASSEQTILKFD